MVSFRLIARTLMGVSFAGLQYRTLCQAGIRWMPVVSFSFFSIDGSSFLCLIVR